MFVKEVTLEPRESAGRLRHSRHGNARLVQVFDLEAQSIAEPPEGRRIGSRYCGQHARSGGGKRVTKASSASLEIGTSSKSVGRPIRRCRSGIRRSRPWRAASTPTNRSKTAVLRARVRMPDDRQRDPAQRCSTASDRTRAERNSAMTPAMARGNPGVSRQLVMFESAVCLQMMNEPGDDRFRPDSAERDEAAAASAGAAIAEAS